MVLLKDIESGFRMIEENDPLAEEEIIYSLIKTETQDVQLYKSNEIDFKIYKSKEIKKFKDGQIKFLNIIILMKFFFLQPLLMRKF